MMSRSTMYPRFICSLKRRLASHLQAPPRRRYNSVSMPYPQHQHCSFDHVRMPLRTIHINLSAHRIRELHLYLRQNITSSNFNFNGLRNNYLRPPSPVCQMTTTTTSCRTMNRANTKHLSVNGGRRHEERRSWKRGGLIPGEEAHEAQHQLPDRVSIHRSVSGVLGNQLSPLRVQVHSRRTPRIPDQTRLSR